jgi:vacuolar-type H+-ATPase subunit D/Vma8
MIIVKTKNGDSFINDKAVTIVTHNKEKATVKFICDKTGNTGNIYDVESIIYNNESQPISWQENGSEIKMQKLRDDLKELCANLLALKETDQLISRLDDIQEKVKQLV